MSLGPCEHLKQVLCAHATVAQGSSSVLDTSSEVEDPTVGQKAAKQSLPAHGAHTLHCCLLHGETEAQKGFRDLHNTAVGPDVASYNGCFLSQRVCDTALSCHKICHSSISLPPPANSAPASLLDWHGKAGSFY